MSTVKKVLLLLFILTNFTIAGVLLYTSNHNFLNDEDLIGNTIGNIYNGGLYCEKDGKIYFSNDNDNGSLYVMNSDMTYMAKIYNDNTAYINVDENYIYYLRANNTRENDSGTIFKFNNTGIYRINLSGKKLKLISRNPGSYVTLKGNYLYYQNYKVGEGLTLYRQQIDGTEERMLIKEAVIPSVVLDDKLYYTGAEKDHNINVLDLSSFTRKTFIGGNFAYPIFFGDYIYYMDMSDNYAIYRMNMDGTDPTILVDERCSTYNITNSGKYLYYQVDDMDNSKICRLNLETMESEVILKGHYKQIHVTEYNVFFKDFAENITYVVPADSKIKLEVFDPPKLSEE